MVSTSELVLPLCDLDQWSTFEMLCLEFAALAPDVIAASEYGEAGQNQEGIDLLLELADGNRRLVQCKHRAAGSPGAIASAVGRFLRGKFAAPGSQLVLAVSYSTRRTNLQDEIAKQRALLAERDIGFEVWDERSLSRELYKHPPLVERYFGIEVLRAFRPQEADRSMLDQLANMVGQQGAPREPLAALMRSLLRDAAPVRGWDTEVSEVLDELAAAGQSTLAGRLGEYLADDLQTVSNLIDHPPQWIGEEYTVHRALARLASAAGLRQHASVSFERAAGRAETPKERASLIGRAAYVASGDGESTRAAALLEAAAALDKNAFEVVVVRAAAQPPEKRIAVLSECPAPTERQREVLDAELLDAYIESEQAESAFALVEAMLERRPDSLVALDRRAMLILKQHDLVQTKASDGLLMEAADASEQLAGLLSARGRVEEASNVWARGGDALALAGRRDEAIRCVNAGLALQPQARGTIRALAAATLHAAEPHRAVLLLGSREDWDDGDYMLAARAWAASGQRLNDAYEIAMGSLESHRAEAIWVLVLAAAGETSLPWREDFYREFVAAHPVEGVAFRAERLSGEGNDVEADKLLRGRADHPEILRVMVGRALERSDWTRALALAEQLCLKTERIADHMYVAMALHGTGRTQRLREELEVLAGSAEVSSRTRSRAFGWLVSLLDARDHVGREQLCRRWGEAMPGDPAGELAWARALAVLARHEQALAILDTGRELSVARAETLAVLVARTTGVVEAATRVLELLESVDEPSEPLAINFLGLALQAEDHLPEDSPVLERLGRFLQSYSELFPDSEAIRSFSVPDDPEGIVEAIRTNVGFDDGQSERAQAASEQVLRGEGPMALLAGLSGRPTSQIWARSDAWPVSFGTLEEVDSERDAARASLGQPIVIDINALTVGASVGSDFLEAAFSAFAGIVVPWSSLHEADRADSRLHSRATEELLYFDAGGVRMVSVSEDDLDRERRIVSQAFAFARRAVVANDADSDQEDRLDALLKDGEKFASLSATSACLSVARRRGLAVYSDDRFVRTFAKSEGIPCFGSVALIEVVELPAATYRRRCLLRNGAVGMRPTAAEIFALVEEAEFEPAGRWLAILFDKWAWNNQTSDRLEASVGFLRRIWVVRPDLLGVWTARVIDAIRAATDNGDVESLSRGVLLQALLGDVESAGTPRRAWIGALMFALESLGERPEFDLQPGLLDRAVDSVISSIDEEERGAMVSRFASQLPYPSDIDLLMRYRR